MAGQRFAEAFQRVNTEWKLSPGQLLRQAADTGFDQAYVTAVDPADELVGIAIQVAEVRRQR
jgi:hypothetical protein